MSPLTSLGIFRGKLFTLNITEWARTYIYKSLVASVALIHESTSVLPNLTIVRHDTTKTNCTLTYESY